MSSSLPTENIAPTKESFLRKGPMAICTKLIESFSTNDRKRHSSWSNKSPSVTNPCHVRLITIGASHYCEKARWALDLVEADSNSPFYYTEDAHPPIFAAIATLKASRGLTSMTPMAVYTPHENGKIKNSSNSNISNKREIVLHDSSKIIRHFCPFLYPPAKEQEIMQFETYMGEHLGATLRLIIYYYFFTQQKISHHDRDHNHDRDNDNFLKLVTTQSSTIEQILWKKLYNKGLLASGMKKAMKINPETAKHSLQSVRDVFQQMSIKLRLDPNDELGKKEYIMDSIQERIGFTAADLTFCALAAPIISPPELEVLLKSDDEKDYPKQLIELRHELRGTLAGQHVLEIYRKHRLGVGTAPIPDNCTNCNNNTNSNMKSKHVSTTETNRHCISSKRRLVIPKVVRRDRIPLGMILSAGVSLGAILTFQREDKNSPFQSKL